METTDKYSCQILVELLVAHGVKNVVMSPGSRNMPLMVAVSRCHDLRSTVVVDERVAAFVALGMAAASGIPTAIICTSGTAVLNYAPAVAEAYYKHIPLVVISADRPYQWIDQDDSQTIRQNGALSNIVKRSCDLPDVAYAGVDRWYSARVINDALIEMRRGCLGPVHINVQLAEPLNGMIECDSVPLAKTVRNCSQSYGPSSGQIRDLAMRIARTPKVMILAGFLSNDLAKAMNQSLGVLGQRANVTVLTESISNLSVPDAIRCIDVAVSGIEAEKGNDYAPDLLITVGGALVSRFVKQFLRTHSPSEHWHVGHTHSLVDCMQALTLHVDMSPDQFFKAICQCVPDGCLHSGYSALWSGLYESRLSDRDRFVKQVGWCDLKAFSCILPEIPYNYNLQLSNGTPIRYAQLLADVTHVNTVDCNRGTSGIDGSTSTAVGAAMVSEDPTVLITGDTSAQYDMGALALRQIPRSFRMIVINNGGGGIFRFIKSTSAIKEREMLFAEPVNFPVRQLAEAYGFAYFSVDCEAVLKSVLSGFWSSSDKAILEICGLPAEESAIYLRELLRINK